MLTENKPHVHLIKQVSTEQLQSDQQFKQIEKIVTGNFLSFFPPSLVKNEFHYLSSLSDLLADLLGQAALDNACTAREENKYNWH